jgi:hypothetical protein
MLTGAQTGEICRGSGDERDPTAKCGNEAPGSPMAPPNTAAHAARAQVVPTELRVTTLLRRQDEALSATPLLLCSERSIQSH